ncbi:hypothetical protein BpHYR1_020906 [Brachionus plicatilis]|uniref:Uncharacterized protein n=1 Tax=Brachionus plicatilis TaxID=10195 RepID=A0A3M7RF40_BRAPC|nr:hypothetical protein BpHYR1_020906 [Brachionus plicatilis]
MESFVKNAYDQKKLNFREKNNFWKKTSHFITFFYIILRIITQFNESTHIFLSKDDFKNNKNGIINTIV